MVCVCRRPFFRRAEAAQVAGRQPENVDRSDRIGYFLYPSNLENEVILYEIKELLEAEVIVGEDRLDMEVKTAFMADLMSDVLAFATAGSLLITGLANAQVLRTADVMDICAIVMGRGKMPSPEAVQLARALNIPVLTTKFILFEIAGRLYANGVKGCIEKVGSK